MTSNNNKFEIDPLHEMVNTWYPLTQDVWQDKYRHKSDSSLQDTFKRVAAFVMADEPNEILEDTYKVMNQRLWMPAGRILAGAGTKKIVTLNNCYVMNTIPDSMEGIADVLKESMLTMQQGGGIGLDFSTLRPEGAHLKRTGSPASGPLPFMDMWDAMCKTIMSAGSRRGAMMACMRVDHPDIKKFIQAKQQAGRLEMFNMSVLVTDKFMEAVADDDDWKLISRVRPFEENFVSFNGDIYVYETVEARDLWALIMQSTYESSEPGVIFIDRMNQNNNLNYCETIAATNPCSEQPLPPYGACDLGHVNLAQCVKDPFTAMARVDYNLIRDVVAIGVRFLDNVIDKTHYPLEAQKTEQLQKRRIGLGISGLADMLSQLKRLYGDDGAIQETSIVMGVIAKAAYRASARLAQEKGVFPLYDAQKFGQDGVLQKLDQETQKAVETFGLRNGTLTSVAPTGTTSIVYGNISAGIEPNFLHHSKRKVLQADGTKKEYDSYSYISRLYCAYHKVPLGSVELPDFLATADKVTIIEHIRMQAACQQWVDTAISKTINCPEDIPYEDFKDIYLLAADAGLKGVTTYRPSEIRGSILSAPTPKEESSPAADPAAILNQDILWERPNVMDGCTYKLKWPFLDSAIYLTITHQHNRPYEIFISCKNSKYYEWTMALTRLISAIMRTHKDIGFIIDELQQVTSVHEACWIDRKHYGSLVAYIGATLHKHVMMLQSGATQDGSPAETIPGSEDEDLDDILNGCKTIEGEEVSPFPEVWDGSQNDTLKWVDEGDPLMTMEEALKADAKKLASMGVCPMCNAPAIVHKEGCDECTNCGYSNCG